jgi:3-isopropylmalate dehydrogenase
VTRTIRLAVVPGDGIGPEVTAEALRVLEAVLSDGDVKVAATDYDLGARRWLATGETLPDSVLEELRGHDAILLGAVGDPAVPSACPAASSSAVCCCGCASSSTTT